MPFPSPDNVLRDAVTPHLPVRGDRAKDLARRLPRIERGS